MLTPLEHGNIIFSEDRTTFGVVATYACHENYTLIGNENRTCGENGWTGSVPQCLVDWCPEPPAIAGGKVELTGKRAGSTAIYKCDSGHILIGDPVCILLIVIVTIKLNELLYFIDYFMRSWWGMDGKTTSLSIC